MYILKKGLRSLRVGSICFDKQLINHKLSDVYSRQTVSSGLLSKYVDYELSGFVQQENGIFLLTTGW